MKRKLKPLSYRHLVLYCSFIFSAFPILACYACGSDDDVVPEAPTETSTHMKLNETDSLVMVKLYNTIGPWVPFGWDLHDVTTWLGVGTAFDVATNELRIVEFNVCQGRFHGTIPEEIGDLSELRILIMSGGTLCGPIPESIGKLKHLFYLTIADNFVSGPIPESIGNLTELEYLRISNNQCEGPIPESFGNLTKLGRLQISETNVSGEIPKSLANLKNCGMWLDHNKLSGTFPIELADVKYQVICSDNNIEDLPVEIWSDDNNKQIPDLQGNRISTKIPKWVTEQEKWEKEKGFIELQQEGYGYELE